MRTKFRELYEFYLKEHLPKCLEKGGKVALIFGKEAKAMFQDLLWEDPNDDAKRPKIMHRNVILDVEIVTNQNSKLYRRSHQQLGSSDEIQHLLIYVPDPFPFTKDLPDFRRYNNPLQKRRSAMQTSASLDYAARLIGKELPHRFL